MINKDDVIRAISYDPETGELRWKVKPSKRVSAGELAGSMGSQGYREVKVLGKTLQAHRVAWLLHYGDWPVGFIDHINRDRADNRIGNLRLASRSQNGMNRCAMKNNSSGVKGCYFVAQLSKWRAQCRVSKKLVHLGYFDDLEEARRAYNKFAMEVFGEFFVPA